MNERAVKKCGYWVGDWRCKEMGVNYFKIKGIAFMLCEDCTRYSLSEDRESISEDEFVSMTIVSQ
jgi:hypothetical protein